jgi:4-amino-4-deoxy-L-arabinose transferase-like glycosyltransferase
MKTAQGNSPYLQLTDMRLWYIALLLSVVLSFTGIADRGLWEPDELRDAAVALEMSRESNYIVPRLAGTPFVEKPPLYFATAAGVIKLLGGRADTAAAVRLTSVMWGIGILLMTFLLAQRLMSDSASNQDTFALPAGMVAAMAAAMLSTMGDFIKETHWIRVDPALAFFIVAALWSFAEVYFARRSGFLLLGAVFSAGAFLSKGMIGLVLIGIGWAGMCVPWFRAQRRSRGSLFIWQHAASLILLVLLAGAWVVSLWIVGGRDIFNEWFLQNQLGRLSGTANLGHEHAGNVFYYAGPFLTSCLPWTPLLFIWVYRIYTDFRKQGIQCLSPERIFLLTISIGTLVILTVSVSKRSVYLLPLIPVLAIMCADALAMGMPRWCRYYFVILTGVCVVILAACTLAPVICAAIPQSMYVKRGFEPVLWGIWNGISALCLAGVIYLLVGRKQMKNYALIALTIAAVYICGYKVTLPIYADRENMEGKIAAFIKQIEPVKRPRIAGIGLSEGQRGLFYIVAGWKVSLIESEEEVRRILRGNSPQFDSVIIAGMGDPPKLEQENKSVQVRASSYAGIGRHHLRYLLWVTADRPLPH